MTPVPTRPIHIVDELIHERAPRLAASGFWPVIRPALYGLLGYQKAVAMADHIADHSGEAALAYISRLLSLETIAHGLTRLPKTGRCVVVCNHPTGIADGVAVYDAIRRIRQDAIFFANADALRVCPRLGESVIPVEWVEAKRTREKTRATLLAARDAFEAERCVVLFPAGRLARLNREGVLTDPPWATTAVSLAQKYKAPVVPVHITGPYAFWFHSFNKISKELRDVTLFHELLNKAGKRYELKVGPVIPAEDLTSETGGPDTGDLCDQLKAYVERQLPKNADKPFKAVL
ncbi:1-acyl-sn-glycerol-3-phosphate acyltransferase [Asticcacaulis tiandongensis]|uniref:1-acyl-sn-glycerol-3-phosphate acyltransferase n=1 Tax=Asticcacaulis tiandongensis TaxID=2565365 RepID=UPI0011262BF4|nr:1-acyl-sn-glycerol-3-phosphate acyltransferase [Asticcacaulis tiandongensis]